MAIPVLAVLAGLGVTIGIDRTLQSEKVKPYLDKVKIWSQDKANGAKAKAAEIRARRGSNSKKSA